MPLQFGPRVALILHAIFSGAKSRFRRSFHQICNSPTRRGVQRVHTDAKHLTLNARADLGPVSNTRRDIVDQAEQKDINIGCGNRIEWTTISEIRAPLSGITWWSGPDECCPISRGRGNRAICDVLPPERDWICPCTGHRFVITRARVHVGIIGDSIIIWPSKIDHVSNSPMVGKEWKREFSRGLASRYCQRDPRHEIRSGRDWREIQRER